MAELGVKDSTNAKASKEVFTPQFYRQLQQLKINTRRSFLGSRQGVHRSVRKGQGLEFSDFRHYAPGDDFRHIDWGAYGRTERLYVRQFQEEQDLSVSVMLDSSASMNFEGKYEVAKQLALALGYVALTDGDVVQFSVLGKTITSKFRGPKALNKARLELEKFPASGEVDFTASTRQTLSKMRTPGKCFLISDFLFETEKQFEAIDAIRFRNFDLSVLHVLSPSELQFKFPTSTPYIKDSETGEIVEFSDSSTTRKEYADLLSKHIAEIENYCFSAGVSYTLVSSDEKISDIVLNKLPSMGLLG